MLNTFKVRLVRSGAASLAALNLCACALPVYEGTLAYEEGWSHGVVRTVVDSRSYHPNVALDCRNQPAADQGARWALVEVRVRIRRNEEKPRWFIVAMPDQLPVQAGEKVYLNVQDCKLAVKPRPLRNVV
jgi:hypothetical protein